MPPLILHNVPDEELYVGDDGVQRPYAMLFPGNEGAGTRQRRTVQETGSFGKSTRRSRSRTGTPGPKKLEDPTLAAADSIFSKLVQRQASTSSESPQRKTSLSASLSQPNLSQSGPLTQVDGNAGGPPSRYIHKEPTEVILRGFKSSQQYAAIREYEKIGGRICEDYPRDAPLEQRRYRSDLRDPAALRTQPMTAEEKAKALKFAGGDHWIKVTFESNEAAEAAIESSPQTIHGYLVYAEAYRGVPPTSDEAVPAAAFGRTQGGTGFGGQSLGPASGFQAQGANKRGVNTLPRSFTTPSISSRGDFSTSPPDSQASSNTLDSNTLTNTTNTLSSGTVTGFPPSTPRAGAFTSGFDAQSSQPQNQQQLLYCAKIPTAKRMQLLPAEQALLPQQSYSQRIVSKIPIIGWFSSDIIGTTIPKTAEGEFDWKEASMYWRIMWYIDSWTGWFDIARDEKDD